jgi:hypothetical protein
MDALVEIIKVLNRKRLSKIDVFDKTLLNQNNSNLYYKLYEGLESGKIKDDVSASLYLYGTNEKDARFRKLKSRFKAKALKSILLLDNEDFHNSEQVRAYYECLTHNQTLEILIKATGTTKLIYELVKDDYPKAEKYNFYDILKNYSFYLITYYALKGDRKSLIEEEVKYLKYIDLAQKEQIAKYLYMKSIVNFAGTVTINDELLNNINESLKKLYNIKLEINNSEIDFYYFYLALLYYENVNDLYKLIDICDEADALMNENMQIITNSRKTVILIYRLKTLLKLKHFNDAFLVLQNFDIAYYPTENLYNWYILKEIEFKLNLQNNRIKEAYYVHNQVLANPSYKRQVAELTEKWKIYHAYLVFMDNYLNKGDYKFNLARFLNDVPVNSKDKSGFNFAIRVIEILFNAARKDYNLIFSKMDALRVYRSRYLNDNTYKRNHLFLSVLLKAEKSGFNNKELVKADWQEITELRKQNNYIIADWEIIPYETLWDIFVELAKK